MWVVEIWKIFGGVYRGGVLLKSVVIFIVKNKGVKIYCSLVKKSTIKVYAFVGFLPSVFLSLKQAEQPTSK